MVTTLTFLSAPGAAHGQAPCLEEGPAEMGTGTKRHRFANGTRGAAEAVRRVQAISGQRQRSDFRQRDALRGPIRCFRRRHTSHVHAAAAAGHRYARNEDAWQDHRLRLCSGRNLGSSTPRSGRNPCLSADRCRCSGDPGNTGSDGRKNRQKKKCDRDVRTVRVQPHPAAGLRGAPGEMTTPTTATGMPCRQVS